MVAKSRKTVTHGIAFLLSGFALYLLVSGGYIYAKAQVAQWLINDAWQRTLDSGQQQPPWQWADTWPVAKLTINNEELFVLEGASGRVLAFGPGHISQTSMPGQLGNTVIAGHRDTHFSVLEQINVGEKLRIDTLSGRYEYQVTDTQVVDQSRIDLIQNHSANLLTLVTCYPFNTIQANSSLRYVVQAQQVSR